MASAGEEEVEYESDPEEVKRSLAARRREASDDEGEEEGGVSERVDRRAVVDSDDSDVQGGVAEYDYDDDLDDEEEEEEVYEEELDEAVVEVEGEGHNGDRGHALPMAAKELGGDGEELAEGEAGDQVDGEKKENEPFAVPTAGAFYMHDDRFRDNARGRGRRTFGGVKLWESKDDKKWGHDKFEEMSMHERHYEEGRRVSRGHYRGRGRNRGADRGYTRGNRSKAINENSNSNSNSNNNDINDLNLNQPPKTVRGRGPRRYESSTRIHNQAPSIKNKQSGKPLEKSSHSGSGRVIMSASNAESDSIPSKRHVFASSLNYASPPFYPSASSTKDMTMNQKRDVQAGNSNRNFRSSVAEDGFPEPQPHTSFRGKNAIDSVGMDKLYIDDSGNQGAGKSLTNLHMMPSGSSTVNGTQFPQARSQGRGMPLQGQMGFQPASRGQVNRVSPSTHAVQGARMQGRHVPPSAQMSGQYPGTGSQASSPPKTSQSVNSFDSVQSPPESSKPKNALVKGNASVQGSGRGSFLYSGAQLMGASSGNMGIGLSDQNFPGTPTFLPVMQFGGQHPGGIGVPAVGMAFPGYVGQPQLGRGNSEMTWLPVLAGAAGALGAAYCPPYIAVDGSYHGQPSGQPTSSTSSSGKESTTSKPNNEWKSSQKQEIVSDEFGQRQNKPRRYSEMNFGQ